MLDAWQDERLREGRAKPTTIAAQRKSLDPFFASLLEEDIGRLTPRRAEALYQEATQRISHRTGRLVSVASHRFALRAARAFCQWACRKGYFGATPFRDVKPVGRVNAGKPQLRIEEARRFTQAALLDFEETKNPLSIGALVALTMGLRTSEVLDRVVRDLDDQARYLWIDAGKTVHARRHLEVPELLRPSLLQLAEGKRVDAYLFSHNDQRRPRQKLWGQVRRLCAQACVPVVCTHSLRGLWATLAVQSGAASHAVAASLGHHSFEVTQRHYAQGSVVANAATARVLDRLDQERPVSARKNEDPLKQLDAESVARLAELLSQVQRIVTPQNSDGTVP